MGTKIKNIFHNKNQNENDWGGQNKKGIEINQIEGPC